MVQRYEQILNVARKMEKISPLFSLGRAKSSIFTRFFSYYSDIDTSFRLASI